MGKHGVRGVQGVARTCFAHIGVMMLFLSVIPYGLSVLMPSVWMY